MNSNDTRSFIEETEFYRGQIVYEWSRPEIVASKSCISCNKSFDPYSAFKEYYEHQKEVIDKLQEDKNVLFLAPFNTGRTATSLLYSLDFLFNKHRSVLFVSANSFEKDVEIKFLTKILKETHLDWLVDIHDIKEEIEKMNYVGLFPSINIVELKDLHYFLLPQHNKYASLFESLGLIIYDDFEKFSGNLASNLHFINKRLEIIYSYYNSDYKNLQYLILSKPFHESKGIVEGIFNKGFEILNKDDKEIIPAKVFYWIPAFNKVDIKYNKENKTLIRTTQRESFIDDTYLLAIESLKKGKTTLIYYSNIPFSKYDLKNRDRYLNYTNRFQKVDLFSSNNIFIGYDWSDLTAQILDKGMNWEQIDTIIIALFSGSISDLRDYILHIGNSNSEIIITLPQTPSFQFEINHPSLEIRKDSKEIAKGESYSIFAFSNGEGLLQKHQTISAFEMKNIPDENYREKFFELWGESENCKIFFDQCEQFCKNLFEIEGYDIYSTAYDNYFTLVNQEGKTLGTVDAHEIPDSYFINAVICRQNERFKVSKISINERKIELDQLGEFSLPLSQRELNKLSESNVRSYGFENLKFIIKDCRVSAKFNAYKVSTGTDPHPTSFNSINEDVINLNDIQIVGVEISGFTSAQAFANIFNISLNTKISLYNLNPNYFTWNGSSFFYNLGSDDLKYLVNDANIRDILDRALTILIDCPCSDGCTGCLKDFKIDSINFSKKELIQYLGGILKKDNIQNIIRWKYDGIGQHKNLREDMLKFRQIRNKVIYEILNYKANMIIQDPYQEKFISTDDEKWISSAGLCHDAYKTVYIKPGFNEAIFTEICAHEYTHNWQNEGNLNQFFRYFNYDNIDDQNNIWFEGKLFSEGQANFFAAKVMDYYGLREMVYSNEVQSYAQYREGLILLNYLEQKYGLIKLNFILREAKFENGSPVTIDDVNDWCDESGVKSLIQGLADDLIKENMRCLQIEYLEKSREYHRLSYFMNHQIDRRDKKLVEYFIDAGIDENEAFPKIWEILKKHFHITPKKGYDYIPCKDCAFKDEESLDGLCMMFGSLSVKDEIKKVLKLDK